MPGRSLGVLMNAKHGKGGLHPCYFKYSQEQALAMSLSDIFKKDLEHRRDHDSAFASRHEVWVLHG